MTGERTPTWQRQYDLWQQRTAAAGVLTPQAFDDAIGDMYLAGHVLLEATFIVRWLADRVAQLEAQSPTDGN